MLDVNNMQLLLLFGGKRNTLAHRQAGTTCQTMRMRGMALHVEAVPCSLSTTHVHIQCKRVKQSQEFSFRNTHCLTSLMGVTVVRDPQKEARHLVLQVSGVTTASRPAA